MYEYNFYNGVHCSALGYTLTESELVVIHKHKILYKYTRRSAYSYYNYNIPMLTTRRFRFGPCIFLRTFSDRKTMVEQTYACDCA